MQFFALYSKTKSLMKSKTSTLNSLLSVYSISQRRMSQSSSIGKKQQRVSDRAFDNYMEREKKIRQVLNLQDIILSQPDSTVPVSRLDVLSTRFGFKCYESDKFILKFPHFFSIFQHPVLQTQFCRLSNEALELIERENQALLAQLPDSVVRLRKLLMLSNSGRVGLAHVRLSRKELGLPDDFELSVILKNPQFFRLIEGEVGRNKYIEIVESGPHLARCAVDDVREKKCRKKGADEEKIRFSFTVNFPPGCKVGNYEKVSEWQRRPYWSPYEDVSRYALSSIEAKMKMEKRAVATVHELLSLSVEKKIIVERISHFRSDISLPKKLKEFLLQHPGIFYLTSKGSHGKLHTVFLREAYEEAKLVEPNHLYLARRNLAEFILYPQKAKGGKTWVINRYDEEAHQTEGCKEEGPV